MANKWLIFDSDRSLASIGGPARLVELFGIPPVTVSRGVDEVQDLLKKVMQKVPRMEQHPIFGEQQVGDAFVLNARAQALGMRGIVIDTLSTLGFQSREVICQERKIVTLDKQTWGIYGDKVARFIHLLKSFDIPLVVTCHIARKEMENGQIEVPELKGGSVEVIPRFFDVIAYVQTSKNKEGSARYSWIVERDERRVFAKNRGGYLPPVIEPNLSRILERYAEEGIPNPKILILGDAGSGKTYSLQTLVEGEPVEAALAA
jgi:hypothetical protein